MVEVSPKPTRRPCQFCDTEQPVLAALITRCPIAESDVGEENLYWVCENHFDKIIDGTDYHVRELDPASLTTDNQSPERQPIDDHTGNKVVIYFEDNPEAWLEVADYLECDLADEL